MSNKAELQSNNIDLQSILDTINALPEAGEAVAAVIEDLTITANGTYEAPEGVDGYSPVTVNVPSEEPTLQEKSVTPAESAQEVAPDSGYDGLSKVSVGAIPSEYIVPSGTKSVTENGTHDVTEYVSVNVSVEAPEPTLQSKTVMPTTSEQTVTPDSGYDGLLQVVVDGDTDLIAANIKKGVSIFGVSGSYEGSGGSGGGFPNGTAWTQSNITGGTVNAVCYANGIWVAAAESTLYYSADGMTWTQSNITEGYFTEVLNGGGVWVTYDDDYGGLYYSTDGMTWTQSNITEEYCATLRHENGVWVAIFNERGRWYSTDGMTWTQSNIVSSLYSPEYANGLWFDEKYYSFDGKKWVERDAVLSSVCHADGLWIATRSSEVSTSPGTYLSADGITWTKHSSSERDFHKIAYTNGVWVAVSPFGDISYSTDGETWTDTNVELGGWAEIHAVDGVFFVFDSRGFYYSTDGMTWVESSIGIDGLSIRTLCNANGVWVVGGNNLYYSTDGKTWVQSNVGEVSPQHVLHANGMWVACTTNGIYYSVTWKPQ